MMQFRDELAAGYSERVRPLFSLGEPPLNAPAVWLDYPAVYGLDASDVPELIRLACDRAFDDLPEADVSGWACEHAWRALGRIGDPACIPPIMVFLDHADDLDYLAECLPDVAAAIGPMALEPLITTLHDRALRPRMAANAGRAMVAVASVHTAYRDNVVAELVERLGTMQNHETNGLLIGNLIDLKAVEAIEAIHTAFALDRVDISISGDLEDVEIELGLRTKRDTPKPRYFSFPAGLTEAVTDLIAVRRANPVLHESRPTMPSEFGGAKIGRNEPCPCGSGKKYKKCCMQ